MLDDVTLYRPDPTASSELAGYREVLTGDGRPFAERPVRYRNFVFDLREPPGTRQEYFVRVRTASSLNTPFHAWSPRPSPRRRRRSS